MNIKEIQILLNKSGVNLVTDNILGAKTKAAIKEFQQAHGLVVDGKPGPITQYELMFYKYSHFRKDEFKCKCGGKYCNGYPVKLDENLLIFLEKIRSELGNKPIKINSAIRCRQHNKNVGGVFDSMHIKGKAVDFTSNSVDSLKESQVADKIVGGKGAVLRYISKNFVHIDTSGTRTRVTYK